MLFNDPQDMNNPAIAKNNISQALDNIGGFFIKATSYFGGINSSGRKATVELGSVNSTSIINIPIAI